MTLDEFLIKNQITQAEFALQVGVTQQMVSLWASGKKLPRPPKLNKIEKLTGGRVRANDFMSVMYPNGGQK